MTPRPAALRADIIVKEYRTAGVKGSSSWRQFLSPGSKCAGTDNKGGKEKGVLSKTKSVLEGLETICAYWRMPNC